MTWNAIALLRRCTLDFPLECRHGVSAVAFAFSGGKQKLTLDQDSFQQLLAAAYALQENKDVLRAGSSENDSASVLSEIAALRSQILAHPHVAKPHVVNSKDAETKPKTAIEAAA